MQVKDLPKKEKKLTTEEAKKVRGGSRFDYASWTEARADPTIGTVKCGGVAR